MERINKMQLGFVAFLLVLATIACSASSNTPAGVSSGGNTPPVVNAAETPASTLPTMPQASSSPAFIDQATAQINVPAGQAGSATATCPGDSLMLGGGFASEKGMKITKTMPDPSGWLVSGLNTTGAAVNLTAYAACLHNAAGTVRVEPVTVPVSGAPFARCQKGEIVTGGGFADETGSLDVYISTPIGDSIDPNNAWSVMARSTQNADQPITVYAVCLSKSNLTSSLVRDDKVNYGPGGNSLDFTLACPTGLGMSEGGYEGTGVYVNRVNSTDLSVWEIQVQEKNFFDGSLDHAVCLSLP